MLIDSLFPEEARKILINYRFIGPSEFIEDLFGRRIIIRFDMLGGQATSAGCFKLSNETYYADANGLKRVKDDLVLESITRSCKIKNVEVGSFLFDSRVSKFSSSKDLLDYFQFKIFIDFKISFWEEFNI